jgi:hypothetical protein
MGHSLLKCKNQSLSICIYHTLSSTLLIASLVANSLRMTPTEKLELPRNLGFLLKVTVPQYVESVFCGGRCSPLDLAPIAFMHLATTFQHTPLNSWLALIVS